MLARFQAITDLTPWFWWDALQMGGGTLNAGLTHILGMLETITGRQVVKVTGEAHVLCWRAPIVPTLHDYRQRGVATLTPAEAAKLEWRACDADNAFSALLHFAAATPKTPVVWVYINVSVMADFNAPTNGWYFYGHQGLLVAEGLRSLTVFRYNAATAQREPLPAPSRLVAALPQVGDDVQDK